MNASSGNRDCLVYQSCVQVPDFKFSRPHSWRLMCKVIQSFFYDDKFQIDVFNGLTLLKCQYYKSGLNDYLMAKLHLFSL